MKVLVIRHAVAQDREDFKSFDDDLRPLTSKGKKEFEKVSRSYKKLYPDVQEFYSSSLLRATETADILKKKFKKNYKIIEELRPESNSLALLKKLKNSKKNFVAIIGHEPSLSRFIGQAIVGQKKSIVELKKGGACLLELSRIPKIITLHSPKSILKT
ncbi:MAG: histidine phosphatase family protein [Bdellovibrionota bacterium]